MYKEEYASSFSETPRDQGEMERVQSKETAYEVTQSVYPLRVRWSLGGHFDDE